MSQIIPPKHANRQERDDDRRSDSEDSESDRTSSSSSSGSSRNEDEHETMTTSDDETLGARCRDATIFASVMKQSQWKVKISSNDNRVEFDRLCSLCLRQERIEATSGDGNRLIRPCLCVGYRSRHHKRCIEEWVEQTGATSCPFCHVRYELARTKKSIIDYFKEMELQGAFEVNFGMYLFSIYLLLVGVTVCYKFIMTVNKCSSQIVNNPFETKNMAQLKSWQDLEELVDCHRSLGLLEKTHGWLSVTVFGLTFTGTVVLFFSIISLCLKFIITHYLRYLLWSKTNFKVSIEPYQLIV